MLRSRTVADNIVDRFSLMQLYKKKLREDARKKLISLTDVIANKEGTISISVEDYDPRRAADMANAYIEELEKLTKTLAVTDASKRRIFFEQQAKAASDDLAQAELALKKTEETTGIIQLDSQSRVMLEAYADLRAQVTAKEAQVQAMSAFATPENPDLMRAQQELAALRTQLARYERGGGGTAIGDVGLEKVPTKALEWIRRYRDVKYREALLTLLLKQYEIARIDEGKEAALIQPLDKAVPPERKSGPHRSLIVLGVTLFAGIIAVVIAYIREGLEQAKDDPQFVARLQLFRFYLRSGKKA
jgi:capsule polysaccharide export protein KpsE/RkpR